MSLVVTYTLPLVRNLSTYYPIIASLLLIALLLLGILSTAIPGLQAEIKCGVVNTMYPEANVIFTIRNYNYVGPYHCNYTFIPPVGYNANIKCQALKIDPSDQDETCSAHSYEIFDKKYCGSTANDSFFEQRSSAKPIVIKIDACSPEASGSYDCKLTTDYERCSCGRLKTVSSFVVFYKGYDQL